MCLNLVNILYEIRAFWWENCHEFIIHHPIVEYNNIKSNIHEQIIKKLTIVQWCAVILRTILATLSFCIYPKNSSGVLAGQQSRPGSDFAENCSLFRNKFNYSRAKLCQFLSKAWHGKSPNIWKKFQAGNLKRNRDRWLSNRTEKYCTISILVN